MKRTDVWEYHSRSFQLSSSLEIAEIIRIIFIQFYDCQHRVVSFRAECQWDSIEFYVGAVSLENGWNSSRVHKLMNLLWKINNIYCVFFFVTRFPFLSGLMLRSWQYFFVPSILQTFMLTTTYFNLIAFCPVIETGVIFPADNGCASLSVP